VVGKVIYYQISRVGATVPPPSMSYAYDEHKCAMHLHLITACKFLLPVCSISCDVNRVVAAHNCAAPIDPAVDGCCWYNAKQKQELALHPSQNVPILPIFGWKQLGSATVPAPFSL